MKRVVLARRTLGAGALWVFGVGASSPLTVLAGGIVGTYALTGVVGVPLSFVVITGALVLLAVGYVAMAKHVVHPAPFYAMAAQGLGPLAGLAAGAVALLGYNAIQISLYGLLGVTLAALAGGVWWAWAAGAWLLIAVLGISRASANARLLGTLLALELAVIVLFDIAALANPAGGQISLASLNPSLLFVNGVGGVFALGIAAFVGFENAPAFGEEARGADKVRTATFASVLFLGVFYTVSAFAVATAVGTEQVVQVARDPESGLPFSVLAAIYGPPVVTLATVLLVTSVLAAMVAFHHTVARYVFAIAREGALPAGLAKLTSPVGGAPLTASLAQTLVAGLVLAVFVWSGADPMRTMFTWLSTIGGLCVLVLLVVASLATQRFFAHGGGTNESLWVRMIAPTIGALLGGLVVLFMVGNLSSLLGMAAGSRWQALVPVLVVSAGLTGVLWGLVLRRWRTTVFLGIGRGIPAPLSVADPRLSLLEV